MRSPLRFIAVAVVVAAVAWAAPLPRMQESVGAAVERTDPSFAPLETDLDDILEEARESTPELDGIVEEAGEPTEIVEPGGRTDANTAGSVEPAAPGNNSTDDHDHADAANEVQSLGPDNAVVGLEHTGDEFHTIGVTLPQPAEVLVRVRGTDGVWESWSVLEMDSSEGPDLNSSEHSEDFATAPVWIGTANAYELIAPEAVAEDLDVVTVRDVPLMKVAVVDREAEAATTTPFAMHKRAEWTGRAAREVNVASEVKMAVVHHTVNTNSYSAGQVPSLLRGIQAYHMDGRGWSDIGYNFVVDKYGGIWEARGGGYDRPVIGAHASGFNTGSVGISVLGDYSAIYPSASIRESVAQVAGWKLFRHGHDPASSDTFTSGGSPSIPAGQRVTLPRVVGHTQVGSTACPGRIINSVASIRGRAQVIADFLTAVSVPLGGLESLGVGGRTATVRGWAIDPGLNGPALVRLTAGSNAVSLTADLPRPDLAASHTQYSTNRGFQGQVVSNAVGIQTVCATVVNRGLGSADLRLSCARRRFTDPSGNSPTGSITRTSHAPGAIEVSATLHDVNTESPLTVSVQVDGRTMQTKSASGSVRFDLRGIKAGTHETCLVVRNKGAGFDSRIDCKNIPVSPTNPIGGDIEITNPAKGWIRVRGWAMDQETLEPINVIAMVPDKWVVSPARVRSDTMTPPHPAYGRNHGMNFNVATGVGKHRVCVVALNVGGGSDQVLDCRDVVVK